MDRRDFLKAIPASVWAAGFPPVKALEEKHFPSRLHQFVWRNWELANLDRMARVVKTTPGALAAVGRSMGLPPHRRLPDGYLRRIYITVIRQNWHLLPESQIVELLGWTREQFDFTLKEDDFLDHKLGRVKPACRPLIYAVPSAADRRRCAAIRTSLGGGVKAGGQPRFAFVPELEAEEPPLSVSSAGQLPEGMISLGRNWRIEGAAGRPALTAAAERFQRYLGALPPTAGRIEFSIEPAAAETRIHASPGLLRIGAPSGEAAIAALYRLRAGMDRRQAPLIPMGDTRCKEVWSPRYLYSYFALYGDPLMEGDAAGLPDGYLDRAAANGVSGVWIQAVLNNLAPAARFPEFGQGWETRLKNLRELVTRAARYGIQVYLYLNEPRAMPEAFFRNRPQLRGSRYQDVYAMCTSAGDVREWLRNSLSHVFREVPGLGGVFTITMSENHTNCFSHGGAWGDRDPVAKDCPRCSKRTGAEAIAEFVQTVRDGVRAQSATARVISYDWGWGTPLASALIPKLPRDTSVLSISEWSQPVNRGGVQTAVGEYSMSVVGPGPRATRNWELARQAGLQSLAKTQFNNTWEISAVPYIPVLPLVLEHCDGLLKSGASGVMSSWTCGGYPSPNLSAAGAYAFEPRPPAEEILQAEAERIYGAAAAADAIAAWRIFSEAFRLFPYGVSIYVLPVQHGPANPLRLRPTGLAAGMILFPYDRYDTWKGAYPAPVAQRLLSELAKRWGDGVLLVEKAVERIPAPRRRRANLELAIARTCQNHFESAANQIEFYLLRDGERTEAARARMIQIAAREKELARRQYAVAREESLIGYEASNHYYYTPLDLLEKVLNCDQVIEELRAG